MSTLAVPIRRQIEDDEIKDIAERDARAAIDLVVRKYRDRIFHHCCYIVKDSQMAMDVTQEVFIKAMREPRFFEPDFKMKAWLWRVASNLSFNVVRNRRRRSAILEATDPPTAVGARQADLIFSNEQQQQILRAMDRLSRDHREILMLRYYSDLSYAEIADTLGVRLGTVMSRLSRAKSQLLSVLDPREVMEGG